MERRPATLLKARFAELSQLRKHLHTLAGRTVFFFREGMPRLIGADRVIVEFSVAKSEQVSTLRGVVLGRVDASDGQTGAWIEFPDTRLARRLERGSAALATRQHQRVVCDLLAEVRQGSHSFLARMMDASLGGARILGATTPRVGAMPLRPGAALTLKLVGAAAPFPAELGRAEAVRVDQGSGELALRWVRSDPAVRVASLKLIEAIRGSWTRAEEMMHAPPCCLNGQVLDPPMPALRGRV